MQTAVEAMKWGTADYIEKPFDQDRLLSHIDDALSKRKKAQEADSGELSREPVVAYIQQHGTQIKSRQDVAESIGFELRSDFGPHSSGHEPVFSQAIAHLPSEKRHATAGDDRDGNRPYRLAHRLCHCAAFQPRLQQYRRGLPPQIPPAKTTRQPVLRSLSQIASSLELPFKFFKSPLQRR